MKKYILLLLLALSFSVPSQAQRAKASLTASTADCSVTASCVTTYVNNSDGAAAFTLSGTWAATNQFEATADGGTSWVALSVTPSNSTTTVTSATGNGTWTANVSAYTNVRIRVSAFTSGTVVASIGIGIPAARSGGGGGSGSGTVSGQASGVIPLGTTATTITQQSHVDDGITTASVVTSSEAIAAPSFGAGTAPAACGTATGCWGSTEASTAGTPTTSQDFQRRDSVTHHDICSWNNGAETSCNPAIPSSWTPGDSLSAGTWPAMVDSGIPQVKQQIVAYVNNSAVVPTGTQFASVFTGGVNLGTTQASFQIAAPRAGTIGQLRVQLSAAEGASATFAVTFEDGSTAESLTCTVGNSATSCTDTNAAHNFTWAAGDLLSWKTVQTGTGTNAFYNIAALVW